MAGEPSGDQLGAEFLGSLLAAFPKTTVTYTGGPKMKEMLQGQVPEVSMERMAFMGFLEVVRHLPVILENDRRIKAHLNCTHPELVLLVDYPGYSLRLASWLHKRKSKNWPMRVIQLVSPQFWAWRPGRLDLMGRVLDAVYPLLPFETKLLNMAGIDAPYYGHPAAWRIKPSQSNSNGPIALLPGSRKQELAKHALIFYRAAQLVGKKMVWYRPNHLSTREYIQLLSSYDVDVLEEEVREDVSSMSDVSVALVASGTATLEVALREIPLVVAYKTSFVTYQIAKRLITVPYISLVNLILERNAVAECIQAQCEPRFLAQELQKAQKNTHWKHTFGELRNQLDRGNPMPKLVAHAMRE